MKFILGINAEAHKSLLIDKFIYNSCYRFYLWYTCWMIFSTEIFQCYIDNNKWSIVFNSNNRIITNSALPIPTSGSTNTNVLMLCYNILWNSITLWYCLQCSPLSSHYWPRSSSQLRDHGRVLLVCYPIHQLMISVLLVLPVNRIVRQLLQQMLLEHHLYLQQ